MKIAYTVFLSTSVFLLSFVSAKEVSELGIAEKEIEIILEGDSHKYIYIAIFGGVVPISNRYVFDGRRVNIEARFTRQGSDHAQILIRRYADIPNEYLTWVEKNTTSQIEYCGLTIKTQNTNGVITALVHDNMDSMVIASWNENEWKAPLEVYCRAKNGNS